MTGQRDRGHHAARTWFGLVGLGGLTAATGLWQRAPSNIVRLELVGTAKQAADLVGSDLDRTRTSIRRDFVFIVAYCGLIAFALERFRPDPASQGRTWLRRSGLVAVPVMALADVTENVALLRGLDASTPPSAWDDRPFARARRAAIVKFASLGFALLDLVALSLWRRRHLP